MYINDIVDAIDVHSLLFADDLKIYTVVNSFHDSLRLQKCLDRVYRWCLNNNLMINKTKCYAMSFTKKEKPIIYRYSIDNTVLTRPEVIRDLGVVFDSKLSFSQHIQAITESAFKSLGFVIRNGREFGDIETLKLLYFTYCRSCLEYASVIWSPVYLVWTNIVCKRFKTFV